MAEETKKRKPSKEGKSFSKWKNFREVASEFGFASAAPVEDQNFFTPQEVPDSTKVVLALMEQLQKQEKVLSLPLGYGNERLRELYIFPLLQEVLYFADPEHQFAIFVEEPIEGEIAWGEFVIGKTGPVARPIAQIIEVKKSDFEGGRAQLYMELYSAFEANIAVFADTPPPVYGALTDAITWIFVCYDGKSFVESGRLQYLIKTSSDKDGLKSVFDLLAYIVKIQLGTLKNLEKSPTK